MSKKSCNLKSYFMTDVYKDSTKIELPKWQKHGFGMAFVKNKQMKNFICIYWK